MKNMKGMKGFGLRPNGEVGTTKRLHSDFSHHGMYEVLNSATAFFMPFMLFMVKHIRVPAEGRAVTSESSMV